MEWKIIKDFSNYSISNTGNIKRNQHIKIDKIGRKTIVKEKILKPFINKDGYKIVTLIKNHKQNKFLVHRLVALHFIDNKNNYPCVNHKDENVLNNNVENLEWCTVSYNNNYGTRQQRVSKTQGKKVIGTKNNETLIFDSANKAEEYFTGKKRTNISSCANGKLKTAYGYKWRWA